MNNKIGMSAEQLQKLRGRCAQFKDDVEYVVKDCAGVVDNPLTRALRSFLACVLDDEDDRDEIDSLAPVLVDGWFYCLAWLQSYGVEVPETMDEHFDQKFVGGAKSLGRKK